MYLLQSVDAGEVLLSMSLGEPLASPLGHSWTLLGSPGLPWAVVSSSLVSCLKGVLGLFSDSKLAQLGSSDL